MDTPMLRKLREYLQNTPHEQKVKDWEAIKSRGYIGGPTVQEFIASFRHTPAYQRSVMAALVANSTSQPDFPASMESQQLAMAA
jgi:hypothetical protein